MIRAAEAIVSPLPAGSAELQQQLRASPYWHLRQLTCRVERDRVIVRGSVPCFFLKQLAHSLAAKTVGPGRIDSEIAVRDA